jgi:hypothetical protein
MGHVCPFRTLNDRQTARRILTQSFFEAFFPEPTTARSIHRVTARNLPSLITAAQTGTPNPIKRATNDRATTLLHS